MDEEVVRIIVDLADSRDTIEFIKKKRPKKTSWYDKGCEIWDGRQSLRLP